MSLNVWNVKSKEQADKLASFGANFLTTDFDFPHNGVECALNRQRSFLNKRQNAMAPYEYGSKPKRQIEMRRKSRRIFLSDILSEFRFSLRSLRAVVAANRIQSSIGIMTEPCFARHSGQVSQASFAVASYPQSAHFHLIFSFFLYNVPFFIFS